MISAYNLAIGVEERRYPYRQCIQSALMIADEFCIAYDPRFDNPERFTAIASRVKAIEIEFDFTQWDFINVALTTARRACIGDWLLYLENDEVLHEKDAAKIADAVEIASGLGIEAVNLKYIEVCQEYVQVERIYDMGYRQKITINKPFIYHKTADYMIGYMDSPVSPAKLLVVSTPNPKVVLF